MTEAGRPPYLALARGALVMGVLPGAAAVVNNPGVAAGSRPGQYRERGTVPRHLSCTGIVLATRTTVPVLCHGVRAGHRWTLHLPAVYFAVLKQIERQCRQEHHGNLVTEINRGFVFNL